MVNHGQTALWYKQGLESEIACSDYPYSFFNANFLFQKVNRFLKEERVFFINLVLFPWRSETTQKTSLWIEKYQKCLLFQIAKKLSQITFSFALILQITTKCCYKLGQSSYTLEQVVLQITTAIKNYENYYKLRQNTMAKKSCFNTVERGHELEAGLNEIHELTWLTTITQVS